MFSADLLVFDACVKSLETLQPGRQLVCTTLFDNINKASQEAESLSKWTRELVEKLKQSVCCNVDAVTFVEQCSHAMCVLVKESDVTRQCVFTLTPTRSTVVLVDGDARDSQFHLVDPETAMVLVCVFRLRAALEETVHQLISHSLGVGYVMQSADFDTIRNHPQVKKTLQCWEQGIELLRKSLSDAGSTLALPVQLLHPVAGTPVRHS